MRSVFQIHRTAIVILALAGKVHSADEDDDDEDGDAANTTKPYVPVSAEGLHWVETFDGDVFSRWSMSSSEKYTGKWQVGKRKKEALVGDLGLFVPEEAKHYGIAAKFPPIEGQQGVPFVVQFEATFQDGLSCGGSYIKLFDSEGKDAADFKDDTPYVIMFGPDRCGQMSKVHFILRHKNPVSGEWEEKHNNKLPSPVFDDMTHLYTLVIKPDNSFDILIDGKNPTTGNLLSDMAPAINPSKEIDDPEDSKPTDWVDEAKIDDPKATKPDDWDESAPMKIDDPSATKPAGWNDEAPLKIEDPEAKKPEDWDDDEDGDWEAPIIDNPACKVGCGTWQPPKVANPAYKGKWYAPKIDNPEYKGAWKPRQIDNPHYFVDETPYILPIISGVGIDIWTMSKGIIFDNIVISIDQAKAKAFADNTFKVRRELEELQSPKPRSFSGNLWSYVEEYGAPAAITAVVVLAATIWFCCCRGEGAPPPPAARPKPQKTENKEGQSSQKPQGEETQEPKDGEEKPKKKEEGGLDIDNNDD